ncbi:protein DETOXIFICATION 16-like isoform X1 [Phoenix dactylifera]|uniref:Protein DETOXIFICATION n=1 Tax=Phoenix dactylifera TaxID=42345 RepID=A0A8B9ADP0_PHODC|nr:protein DETOXIFICATION 16-like isoform X1 [Phoenix dactylifera]
MGREEVVAELTKQLSLAGPLIGTNLMQYVLQAISVMFVGHLGELPLAGTSMAASFTSVTGFCLMFGMVSALDTLCGQAFGAKQNYMLGIHKQAAMLVVMLVGIPIAFMWNYTSHILIALRQDPEISKEAGLYAQWLIPALFGYGLLQCHVKFLQNQNIVYPQMLSSGLIALLHILLCWALVIKIGLGTKGAALAISISYGFNVMLLAVYIRLSPACQTTWTGFSRKVVHNICNFIKLAIPPAIMICLEFWSFEMLVILSGILPNPKLETSVLSICLNTSSIVFMISLGLSNAISTRVSNELGANHPQAARLAVRVMLCLVTAESLITGLAIILVRNVWGKVYSNEQEVVKSVASMMPLLALSHLIDGAQCVLSGTTRGCGWQKIGAVINLGAFYIVGIPTSVLLAFVVHMGGKGLWIGIICALFVQDLFYGLIMIFTNWEKEARKAGDRVNSTMIPMDGVSLPA